MRLSMILAKWPKKLPNGNIWIGKYRMVHKPNKRSCAILNQDIQREKWNLKMVLNPAISREEEDKLFKELEEKSVDYPRLTFQMRKYKNECIRDAPMPLSQHYNNLRSNEGWEGN